MIVTAAIPMPVPVPVDGVQLSGEKSQTVGPMTAKPFRSIETKWALIEIPSVFSSGTVRLPVSR